VTICTQDRLRLLGDVKDHEIRLNEAGRKVQETWDALPTHYAGVETDAFNHLHGIIVLVGLASRGRSAIDVDDRRESGQPRGVAPTLSLSDMVHRFKTMTTKRYADGVRQRGWPPFRSRLWQRNYYEHVIRDNVELERIRKYILDNPARWEYDRENPDAAHIEPKDT
jgi:REP element-mobilizing transposase RayT